MTIDITACPHCHTAMIPLPGGICSSCRKDIRLHPEFAEDGKPSGEHHEAWENYQKSLRVVSAAPPVLAINAVEQQYAEMRKCTWTQFGKNAAADSLAAEIIEHGVLPQYAASVEQLRQDLVAGADEHHELSRVLDLAEMRQNCWQLLLEALRENDTQKLQQHITLWESSECDIVDVAADRQPVSKETPEQHVRRFQQSLVTFTPRLIATPGLILANVVVFVVMIVNGVHPVSPDADSVLAWGANFGPKTMNGEWWRLATSLFLHFGMLHLGFNMWVLWSFGRLVERLVGNAGFLILYLVSGIAGSILSLAWNPVIVSAGASGAVFGVGGALLGFIVFRHDTVPAEVLRQLWKGMAFFIGYNVFFGITHAGIDNAAHAGGLVAGFLCGLILSQSLSVEMIVRRRVRNLGLAGIAAIALPLSAMSLPAAPPDIEGELNSFVEMEKKTIDAFNSVAERHRLGQVDDTAFANALDKEVIPQWAETRGRIEQLTNLPYGNQAFLSQLVQYARLREEGWRLLAEGLREQNSTKFEQGAEKSKSADELTQRMGAQ